MISSHLSILKAIEHQGYRILPEHINWLECKSNFNFGNRLWTEVPSLTTRVEAKIAMSSYSTIFDLPSLDLRSFDSITFSGSETDFMINVIESWYVQVYSYFFIVYSKFFGTYSYFFIVCSYFFIACSYFFLQYPYFFIAYSYLF